MKTEILIAVLLPFLGTAIGSAGVFLFKNNSTHHLLRCSLTGFAAGVMVAASVWSLLLPAIDLSSHLGRFAFFPAFAGIWGGCFFLMLLDRLLPCLPGYHPCPDQRGERMMVLAVVLHNLPEGMAVGAAAAGCLAGNAASAAAALTLSVGIALQNLPEGAIISMPLRQTGMTKGRAFAAGVMSGIVEPIGAVVTILLAQWVIPALPCFLSFSAGAMLYVVVRELIPDACREEHTDIGALLFAAGFTLMMMLDVALG